MSLAGQISDIVSTLAATSASRREALVRVRADTARHLSEARVAHRRMASAQQRDLAEAIRNTKLSTAILLGAADEQIDGYRKARIEAAARLDRELAEGLRTLRSETSKWISAQSAARNKEAAENLRQRRRDRKALAAAVVDLTAGNVAFVAELTRDRQEASAIWHGRGAAPAAAPAPRAVAPSPVKVEVAAPAPVVAKPEPVKAEPVKHEPVKAEPVKQEPVKVEAKVEAKPMGEAKPAVHKAAEKSGSGKSA